MNPLRVVLADLRRSRASSSAVVVLVAIAVALGVAVSAQERALRAGSTRAADPFDLVIGARGSPTQLVLSVVYLSPGVLDLMPGAVLAAVASDAGAAYAAPVVLADQYRGFPVVGSTADLVTDGGRRQLGDGRLFATAREVVIGADVPLGLGQRFTTAHGPVDVHGGPQHAGFDYTVVGRMKRLGSPWDRAIVAPVEALWELHARPNGHPAGSEQIGPPWDAARLGEVSAIVVKPRSVGDAYRLRTRYRAERSMALFPAEVLLDLYRLLGNARDGLAAVAGVSQGLVLIAVLLAVSASLAQRRRDLAVLRALGAPRRYCVAAVWLRVSVVTGSGAALGLALGWVGARALSAIVHARTGIAITASLSSHEIAMAAAVTAIGAALAVVPAWRSYRESLSTALRA